MIWSRECLASAWRSLAISPTWSWLALQATAMGLVSHGMAGFDFEKAQRDLKVPDDFAVAAMFALGRPGNPGDLPADLRERETITDRRPGRQRICEGVFAFDVL